MDGPGAAKVILLEGFRFDLAGGGLFRLDQAGTATLVSISSRIGSAQPSGGAAGAAGLERCHYGNGLAQDGSRRRQPDRPDIGVAPHS